jgi:hypothetical protein
MQGAEPQLSGRILDYVQLHKYAPIPFKGLSLEPASSKNPVEYIRYYPDWQVDHLINIMTLRVQGMAFLAIKQQLGDDWEAIERAFNERS